MRLPSLTLALTAFNEEEALPGTLIRCLEFLPQAADEWELLIVDDGSKDRTSEIAHSLAEQHSNVRVLVHSENKGMGSAIQTAIKHSKMAWFCTIAADGQVDPCDLTVFITPALQGQNVFSHYSTRNDGWDRKVLTFGFQVLFALITGIWRVPTGNYFVKTQVLKSLPLRSDTFFANYEVYLGCIKNSESMAWVQIPCTPREHGESKVRNLRTIFRVAKELFRHVRG